MLILSRRADESIMIGDEVILTILSVKGKQVRIGISAPPDVSVHREEIYQRIQDGEPNELRDRKKPANGATASNIDEGITVPG